jgi:hypothetical protein
MTEPQLKVSAHDRVSSMIVALLYLVGFIVFLLFLFWLTTRPSSMPPPRPVEYLDELPGGEPALGEGRDFEQPGIDELQDLAVPTMEEMLTAIADVASSVQATSDALSGSVSQGQGGGDRRRAGAGGDASVPRWERWQLRFKSTSLQDYAKQLDFFRIELAAAGGGSEEIDYVSELTSPRPRRRSASGGSEERLYMSYRSGQLKEFDRQLLQRAGITTSGRQILQFYPPEVEGTLAALERQKAGTRPLKEIRKTVFAVRSVAGGYAFEVIEQQYRR